MSEVTDLVVIERANALTVFKSADQIEEILAKVEREVMSFVPDVTTAKGVKRLLHWPTGYLKPSLTWMV